MKDDDLIEEIAREEGEPDYFYIAGDWEYTYAWSERSAVEEDICGADDPREIRTLRNGPTYWVVDTPVTFDEHGDWDDSERRWFRSREDAIAARDRKPSTKGDDQ